jgi:hypothetical protein
MKNCYPERLFAIERRMVAKCDLLVLRRRPQKSPARPAGAFFGVTGAREPKDKKTHPAPVGGLAKGDQNGGRR